LRVEELEHRWVPSGITTTSSGNWAGYAVSTATGAVTSVSGQWTVPAVTATGTTSYSSTWVGIDGFNSNSVEQLGTSSNINANGTVTQYFAWYEMYPNAPVTELTVSPGDTISASVTANAAHTQFPLTLTDLSIKSGHDSFSVVQAAPVTAKLSSAEWIEEAPSSGNRILPLANFHTATFTNASATINSVTGPINNPTWLNEVNLINMETSSGALEAGTSVLNSSGTGFTVTYGSTGTPPSNPSPPTVPTVPTVPTTPTTGSTTTTLSGTVNPYSRAPSVILTAVVSPSVPVGSKVELMYDGSVLATGTVEDVNGVDEVSFTVTFYAAGTYNFTASFEGATGYAASTSNTVTVSVM